MDVGLLSFLLGSSKYLFTELQYTYIIYFKYQ